MKPYLALTHPILYIPCENSRKYHPPHKREEGMRGNPKPLEYYEDFVDALDYNPKTGAFTWKQPSQGRRKNAGCINQSGYVQIGTSCKLVLAHRLAWVITYGELPDNIDHINGNRSDNRISNLRSVTHAENMQNRASGYRFSKPSAKNPMHGVYKTPSGWRCQVTFKTKKEAIAARLQMTNIAPLPTVYGEDE